MQSVVNFRGRGGGWGVEDLERGRLAISEWLESTLFITVHEPVIELRTEDPLRRWYNSQSFK